MASVSTSTYPYPTSFNRRPASISKPVRGESLPVPVSKPEIDLRTRRLATSVNDANAERRRLLDLEKLKQREARERKEEVNRKVASKKAISVILRREATKAVIEKKRGPINSKKLLPRTVLEALHERITALRWESALKVTRLNSSF